MNHRVKTIKKFPKFMQNIVDIALQRLHPQRIILFGSRARSDAERRSDYDIAIEVPGVDDGEWARFVLDVQENLDTLLAIDIVRFDSASTQLRHRIEKEGIVLYEQ